jgi:hypothetical protein
VVVCPVTWHPNDDGKGLRRWYFHVAYSKRGEGFYVEAVQSLERELVEAFRNGLLMSLMQRHPIVIHDCPDELFAARLCASLWPCDRTRELLDGIENKRKARACPS